MVPVGYSVPEQMRVGVMDGGRHHPSMAVLWGVAAVHVLLYGDEVSRLRRNGFRARSAVHSFVHTIDTRIESKGGNSMYGTVSTLFSFSFSSFR